MGRIDGGRTVAGSMWLAIMAALIAGCGGTAASASNCLRPGTPVVRKAKDWYQARIDSQPRRLTRSCRPRTALRRH